MAQSIKIENLNFGGIADSDYLGNQSSVAEMVGLDIHSEPGVIKLNQALTKESGTTVDEFVKDVVPCSDGKTYLFSSTSGKIWSRASNGTYTLEATAAPAAGSAAILGAMEYQGYIYYAMQSRLGRWQIGTAWSGRNDSWATFTNTDASFHPMKVVNGVLYIGDAHFVAQVDAGTFTANALDIKQPLRIKSLGRIDTDLLLGTYVNDNVNRSSIIRWNTWSVSYSVEDEIPEVGVNAFLDTDNMVIVSAGTKGNLYVYDGSTLEQVKTIKGDYGSSKVTVHQGAVWNFNGLPLFGLSQVSGTGVNLGVYSYGSSGRGYPVVLNLEYKISPNVLTGIEIGAIAPISADQFIVSWKHGTTYGVDALDLTAKQSSGYFTTRVFQIDRVMQSMYGRTTVAYKSLPSGSSITIGSKVNHGTMTDHAADEHITDTDRHTRYVKTDVGKASTLQQRVTLTPNGNNSPEIESYHTSVT